MVVIVHTEPQADGNQCRVTRGLELLSERFTKEELERINRLKPDYIQGYYFGKPCPYEKFYHDFIEQA